MSTLLLLALRLLTASHCLCLVLFIIRQVQMIFGFGTAPAFQPSTSSIFTQSIRRAPLFRSSISRGVESYKSAFKRKRVGYRHSCSLAVSFRPLAYPSLDQGNLEK